ncbi:MAG: SH3 domain-containing protein [Christensenellales bacterium]|jgi:peptidoglycan hydrolase-like protein with peptidoglycan-binding domain
MEIRKIVTKVLAPILVMLTLILTAMPALATDSSASPETTPKATATEAPKETEQPQEDEDAKEELASDGDEAKTDETTSIAAVVTCDDVNMRNDADLESQPIVVLPKSEQVMVVKPGMLWTLVEYAGLRGYVRNDFIYSDDLVKYGFVVRDGVNLRKGPGTDNEIIKEMKAGVRYDIVGYEEGWYSVTNGEDTGFINKDGLVVSTMTSPSSAQQVYFAGMKGEAIVSIQKTLKEKGFFNYAATGEFAQMTELAVKAFQKEAKTTVDGVVGPATLELLKNKNIVNRSASSTVGVSVNAVKLVDWFSVGNGLVGRGGRLVVTDVMTGISWTEVRNGGYNHMDTVPATAEDTAKMKRAVGGWTWNRRPVWVTVNGQTYAASMNAMPHGRTIVSGNNFPGHHCIHFLNSRTHGKNRVDAAHQNCVQRAYSAGKNL